MVDLARFGMGAQTLNALSTYKPESAVGNVLLLDGDAACYTCTAGVVKIETAVKRFETKIYEAMYMAKCDTARVHLTPRGCFKNGRRLLLGVKPYQANRGGAKKPPLLEVLRSAHALRHFESSPDVTVLLHYDIEADDALMMDAYSMHNGVLVSADKDLNLSPFKTYDMAEGKFLTLPKGDSFGYIERKFWCTDSGNQSSKLTGKGTKFFLAQMLMGDQADNVQGILKLHGKTCGEAGAFNALDPICNADEAVNFVLDAYRAIDQNPVPEAEAMWLLRHRDDNSYEFFREHSLTDKNLQFLNDCWFDRVWKMDTPEELEDE